MRLQQIVIPFATASLSLLAFKPYLSAQAAQSDANIYAALNDLQQARSELQRGPTDFGGHRLAALSATQQAIQSAQMAIKVTPGTGETQSLSPIALPPSESNSDNSHIYAAQRYLERARAELARGPFDFKGYRQAAQNQTGRALQEIQVALNYDTKNERSAGDAEIRAAIRYLEQAREELSRAPQDYNGYRQSALSDTDQALQKARTALQQGNR